MNIRLATYYHAKDVPALPGSNIFHSTELFHVLEQTRGFRPLLLVAYEGKSPVGKLLCITRRSTNLLRFAEKSYAYGTGEYFPSSYPKEHIFQELLSYFMQQFAEKSFLLEFRNLEEPLFGYRYFRQNGYFPIRWLRVRNSLHHDSLDKWMSTSRKRQIHQGMKNGAVIDVARTEADVQAFSVCSSIIIRPRFIVTCPTSVSSLLCWRIHPIADGFLSFVIKTRLSEVRFVCFPGKMPICFFRWDEKNVSAAVSGSACRMGSHAVCP